MKCNKCTNSVLSLLNAMLGKLNVSSAAEKALCISHTLWVAHKQNTMNLSWNFKWLHYVSSLGVFELFDVRLEIVRIVITC